MREKRRSFNIFTQKVILPNRDETLLAIAVMSRGKRLMFFVSVFVLIISSFGLFSQLNHMFMVEIPEQGGLLREGVVGRPRFINPVLASTDVDRDLSQLVYSGLMRVTPSGTLVPDLAEGYEVSEDGLKYTFILKPGLVWHDNIPITSADVAYTISKVTDTALAIKSPRRANWDGVNVETPDQRTIILTLSQPYAPFLENTTLGILPMHIWENITDSEFDLSYYNTKPIGSGPYKVDEVVRDKNELPDHYDLVPFEQFALGKPFIEKIRFVFFGNDTDRMNAFRTDAIDSIHSIEPKTATELLQVNSGTRIERSPLPRVFAAFLNQNHAPVLAHKEVRQALEMATDREAIVQKVLSGYGQPLDGPLPESLFLSEPTLSNEEGVQTASSTSTSTPLDGTTEARTLLTKAGWKFDETTGVATLTQKKGGIETLSLSIATPDVPELREAAILLRDQWIGVGANVDIKVYDMSTFTTDIVASRKYDVLFYGIVLGRNPDPFAYWHSSQRNNPGMNISLYASITSDKLLTDLRTTLDNSERMRKLRAFDDEVRRDIPAIFVYTPDFIYAIDPQVQGYVSGPMTISSDRFLDIHHWYIDSERVWKLFASGAPPR